MSDLTYSVDALTSLGSRLDELAGRLERDGSLGHVSVDDVARPEVVEAIEDFAHDWNDRRESLAKQISSVGELATKAAEAFSEADEELASKVREILEEQS